MAKNGHQIGPMSEAQLGDNIHNGSADGTTLVFTAGMSTWTAVAEIPQLATRGTDARHPPAPPVPPGRTAHEIDFTIEGTEMQYVEVELDPGESAVAEAGAMMYVTGDIGMETVFGDGGTKQQSGVMNKLMGAGKRLLTGESLFMTVFSNNGSGKQQVAFAAPYAGKILAMDLSQLQGELICQKDAFLCAAKGVSSVSHSRKRSAWGSSVARESSCNASRATASPSCTRAARSISSIWNLERRYALTPGAWWLCNRA